MNIFESLDMATVILIILAAVAIKTIVLAAFVWLGAKLTRVRSVTTRHQITKYVLWSMLLMPLLVFLVPATSLPELAQRSPAEPNTAESTRTSSTADEPKALATEVSISPKSIEPAAISSAARTSIPAAALPNPTTATAQPLPSQSVRSFSTVQILAAVYLFVAVVLLIRTLVGWLQCLRLVKTATSIELPAELRCRYPVLSSDRIAVPATIGIVKPKILLPTDWSQWSASDVAMAIAHESSHIGRRDALTTFLATINCALYWFHPLSWILKTRLAKLAEYACDDAVIGEAAAREEYAQCLLRMASRISGPTEKISLGVGMARTALVEQRVDQIMDSDRKLASRRGHVASIFTLALVAIAAALIASIGGFAVSKEDDKPVPERAITGVVLKPDGSPAAGADVFLSTWAPPSIRAQTKADQKGRFVFTDFPDGVHRIIAKQEDMSSSQRWGGKVTQVGDSNLQIELGATSTLKVTVLDSNTGKPIPNAVVEVSPWFRKWQQKANESGVAVYSKLPQENWAVTAKARGFALKAQEVVVSDANTEISVSLSDPGADLFGQVTYEEGKPVAGATVFVSPADEDFTARAFHQQVRTDEQGNYRIASLPTNKKLETRVAKDGFEEPVSSVILQVERGGEQRHDFSVSRIAERTITGLVTDEDGNPVAGAIVSADFRGGPTCETDEFGKYRFVGQLDNRLRVIFKAKGYVPQQHTAASTLNTDSINVTLKVGRRVTGKVVDEKGQPLSNVVVSASKYANTGWISQPSGDCKTDSQGVFAIESLPHEATLRFYKKGYSSIDDVPFPETGDAIADPVRMADAGLIRGKAVDGETGKPVSKFRAYYTWSRVTFADDPPKGSMSMASYRGDLFSNANGEFEFDGFRKGLPLEVTIEAEGYKKYVVDRLVAEADGIARAPTFKLEKIDPETVQAISGRIVDALDKGIAGVEVRLICSDERAERDPKINRHARDRNQFPYNWTMIFNGQIAEDNRVMQFLETTTDAEGKFSFSNVQSAEDIELVLWSDTVVRARKPGIEKLTRAERQSLTIRADQSGTVRGSIDVEASRYASPQIQIGDVTYDGEILDGGKTFEIRGVPPGEYEVLISGDPQPLKIPGQEDNGAFTTSIIKRIPVVVKAGEVARADADGDRM